MRKILLFAALCGLIWPGQAAELSLTFSEYPENQPPPGFRSTVSGVGKPGDWRIVMDEVPPMLPPLTTQAPVVTRRGVLAQLSQDPADEHFPLLIYDGLVLSDFTLTTRVKTVSGAVEQMAGIAFRIQNETNFYAVRISSLGNTFRFYKVVDGQRGTVIGPQIPFEKGKWYEITVECKGNQIRCLLNGKEAIPWMTDTSFTAGKFGFWTKSDSVSYFTDAKVVYTPHEPGARMIVQQVLKEYPRLEGLRIFIASRTNGPPQLIASSAKAEEGTLGGASEQDVLSRGVTYYGKGKKTVAVTLPLRDRNGDVIAAVRVTMKSFAGQTEQNALGRAAPILRSIQARVSTREDLAE